MPPECSTFKEPFQEQLSLIHEFFFRLWFLSLFNAYSNLLRYIHSRRIRWLFLWKSSSYGEGFFHSLLVRLSFFLNLWKRFFLVTYRIDDDDDWQEGMRERMCGTHEARNALQEQGSLLVEKSVVRFFSSRLKKANFPRVLKKKRNVDFDALWKRLFTKDDTQIRANLTVDNNLLLLLLLLLSLYKKCWNPCNYLSFNNEDVLPLGFSQGFQTNVYTFVLQIYSRLSSILLLAKLISVLHQLPSFPFFLVLWLCLSVSFT